MSFLQVARRAGSEAAKDVEMMDSGTVAPSVDSRDPGRRGTPYRKGVAAAAPEWTR